MMLDNGDGTYTGGPFDVITIWHDMTSGRYHAVLFNESPLPGPVGEAKDTMLIRLKSKMHHTGGAETFEEALDHLEDLAEKIKLPEENVWRGAVGRTSTGHLCR